MTPAPAREPEAKSLKALPLIVAGAVAVAGVIAIALVKWVGVSLTIPLQNLAGLLAPLAFAAAVVERAVEIIISPWRDGEANRLQDVVTAATQKDTAAPTLQTAEDLKKAKDALTAYKAETQQIAFGVSLTLSVCASIAGIRALWPFADPAKFTDDHQKTFFLCVDAALSAALISGGADGVHSVMNAVTNFFDNTTSTPKQ